VLVGLLFTALICPLVAIPDWRKFSTKEMAATKEGGPFELVFQKLPQSSQLTEGFEECYVFAVICR
jgi:hypothetical protein